MKAKKVLILGKLPPPYIGPSIATEILLNSELKNRFQLVHLNTKINTELHAFGKWSLGKVFKNLGLYRKLIKLIRIEKPDLVLIPISQTGTGFLKDSFFILLARAFGKKILLHLRGSQFKTWVDNSSFLNKAYVRFILKKCSGAIVLGNNLRYIFKDHFTEQQIFVVPNGADYHFPERTTSDEVRILYFSNLLGTKGVRDVFDAIKLLYENTKTSFSIDFVGAWYIEEDKMYCENILKDPKLPIRVHLPASGPVKFSFFANADIFVFPPREPEGHPWAIVEAMAAGLPVISTDKGAIIESVINGSNGFIVQPANSAEIAQKLQLLIEDAELRRKMGKESRKMYLSNFTEEKMVDKLAEAFTKTIGS